jgi:hypothetical protein
MAAFAGSALAASLPFLLEKLFPGKKEQFTQQPAMSPEQMTVLNQLLGGLSGKGSMGGPMGQGMSYLSNILSGSPESTQAFEAPYMRQFQQQTIPSLAERFSSLGSGAQGSSAFGQQMGAAGAGLQENLASIRGSMQQNALSSLLGFGQLGLGSQPYANIFRPATQGMGAAMAPGLGQYIGQQLPGQMSTGIQSLLDLFKTSRNPLSGTRVI